MALARRPVSELPPCRPGAGTCADRLAAGLFCAGKKFPLGNDKSNGSGERRGIGPARMPFGHPGPFSSDASVSAPEPSNPPAARVCRHNDTATHSAAAADWSRIAARWICAIVLPLLDLGPSARAADEPSASAKLIAAAAVNMVFITLILRLIANEPALHSRRPSQDRATGRFIHRQAASPPHSAMPWRTALASTKRRTAAGNKSGAVPVWLSGTAPASSG